MVRLLMVLWGRLKGHYVMTQEYEMHSLVSRGTTERGEWSEKTFLLFARAALEIGAVARARMFEARLRRAGVGGLVFWIHRHSCYSETFW